MSISSFFRQRADLTRAWLTSCGALATCVVAIYLGRATVKSQTLVVGFLAVGLLTAPLWMALRSICWSRVVILVLVASVLSPLIPTPIEGLMITGGEILLLITVGVTGLSIVARQHLDKFREVDQVGRSLLRVPVFILVSLTSGMMAWGHQPGRGGLMEFVKLAVYFMAYYAAANVSVRDGGRRRCVTVLWIVAFISSAVGIGQAWDIPGVNRAFTLFYSFHDSVHTDIVSDRVLYHGRTIGFHGNPNSYAILHAMLFTLVLSQVLFRRSKGRGGLGLWLLLFLLGWSALLSGSRTGTVALGAGGVYVMLSYLAEREPEHPKSAKTYKAPSFARKLVPVAFLGTALILLRSGLITDIIGSRLLRLVSYGGLDLPAIIGDRWGYWLVATRVIRLSPLLGFGPGEELYSGMALRNIDNEYLWIAGHYGLIGLIVHLGFWVAAFRLGSALASNSSWDEIAWGRGIQGVVITALIGAFAAAAFYDIRLMIVYCTVFGLGSAALRHRAPGNQEAVV